MRTLIHCQYIHLCVFVNIFIFTHTSCIVPCACAGWNDRQDMARFCAKWGEVVDVSLIYNDTHIVEMYKERYDVRYRLFKAANNR